MRVLAVVPSIYDTSPGQRFRIEQWEPLLREKGVEITYAPFEDSGLRDVIYQGGRVLAKMGSVVRNMRRRTAEVSLAGNYDLVYLFREAALLGPPWFERKLAKSGVPVVFDFDDAIFVSYKSPSNGYLSYLKFPQKTAEICRLSAHVMAGNAYLADYARRTNDRVSVIPTTIDTGKYLPVVRENEPEVLTIGWSGSFSTIQHLDTIRDAIEELAKNEKFRLRVIGAPVYKVPGVDTEAMKWRPETEVEDLSAIDIGLMPLPDEDWTRGKCGLKALQYMALSIPTICSPVGVNSTIIEDGVNGLLAGTKDEWVEKITRLMRSADLRRKLGDAGRNTVEREYSARAVAPKVFDVFSRAIAAAKDS